MYRRSFGHCGSGPTSSTRLRISARTPSSPSTSLGATSPTMSPLRASAAYATRPLSMGFVLDVCHLRRSRWDGGTLSSIPPDRIFGIQLGDGPTEAPADLREEAMFHRMLPGEGAFSVADVLGRLTELGVRAPIGPELYQRIWSERPAQEVASDLMAATRAVLSAKIG
jgi:sugar phosphate isomerase/epimerase